MLKQHLKQLYKTVELWLPSANRAPFFKNLMLHPHHPLAYTRVPKAGCSTIIYHMLGSPFSTIDNTKALHGKNALITFGDVNFGEMLHKLPESITLFTVVRDPFSRLLSGFREKIERQLEGPRYRLEFGIDLDAPIDFASFVDRLVDRNPLSLDAHFQPQSLITRADVLRYDQVFRLENMSLALDWLDATLGDAPTQTTVAPHATHASAGLRTVYDASLTRNVADFYAKDFALFGYAPEPGTPLRDADCTTPGTLPLARFPMGKVLALDNRLRNYLPSLLNRH